MDEAANDHNEDEVTWLDAEYVTKILKSYTANDFKELKSFTVTKATAKGENYASSMQLLSVEYLTNAHEETLHNISFIVKSRLENELMSQIKEDFNVFHREAQVYNVIMQEATKLMKIIDDGNILFGPRAIYVDDRIIVQENLKLKGYYICDVKRGFNYEQCRMILEKLAKFHAVSMVLYKKNPDMFRHHLPGNVSENPTPLHELYTNAVQTCIDYCKENPKLQPYVPGLVAFGDKIIAKMINVFSRNQADRFHVLNHGDMWVNNIMFHKTEDQEDDVLFVDYQEGFYGSPGIDWNYLIFSSWQTEVFEHKRDELIHCYHKNLVDVLHKLNYEQRVPTVDDVKKEIVNKGFHGLTTATCLLPILINEHPDLADPITFLLDTTEALENRRIIFNNTKFSERLEVFLAFFAENNIL